MKSEPVLIMLAIHAVIALAVGFGLHVTTAQLTLIDVAIAAIISVIIRQQVTPTQ